MPRPKKASAAVEIDRHRDVVVGRANERPTREAPVARYGRCGVLHGLPALLLCRQLQVDESVFMDVMPRSGMSRTPLVPSVLLLVS